MIAPDKILHFKGGLAVAAGLGVLVLLAANGLPGTAVSVGATGLLVGVEWYQKAHDAGTPDVWDVVAGAIPSWLLGGLVGWLA
jgi:hypothetical protein